MTWQENLAGNVIAVLVIISIIVLVYCRLMNKTLFDVIREVRDGFRNPIEYYE